MVRDAAWWKREWESMCDANDRLAAEVVAAKAEAAALRAIVENLAEAMDLWGVHAPCPCGAWTDRLNERPHVTGCLIASARRAAATVLTGEDFSDSRVAEPGGLADGAQ